ncbi:2Fe-2S iron-sulfur cluster binding domain-containing protein [Aeromicrobium sp. YIM 150415]|uniref:(2Fe-2S)-binding protein n=1 Tax=Aeromicrobium sp. YIM 150415 TaxID=2803912 RepID=UPI001964659A|nr:2Fe-2S iron-sulfur cluster-binding protein [Aeromicrobium sp. YIM 150415]MBM9464179.1 2Fe-2S iron-sulfur cluster binding domain-containing protein [Aeromicrobium sp. YIM 150415]
MTADGTRSLRVNGDHVEVDLGGATPLAEVLRDVLGLRATKLACRRGECGACTVLVGERPVMSCVTPVALVDQPVTTLEGLAEEIADVRAEFADRGAFQCGFCTPGQLVHIAALLSRSSEALSDEDLAESIRAQLSGNICRCTGYQAITAAVCAVVRRREADEMESR